MKDPRFKDAAPYLFIESEFIAWREVRGVLYMDRSPKRITIYDKRSDFVIEDQRAGYYYWNDDKEFLTVWFYDIENRLVHRDYHYANDMMKWSA